MTLLLLLCCSLSWAAGPTAPGAVPAAPPPTEVAASPVPASPPATPGGPPEVATASIGGQWTAQLSMAASILAVLLALGAGVHSVLLERRIRRLEGAARGSPRTGRDPSRGTTDSTAGEGAGVSLGSSRAAGTRGEGRHRTAARPHTADSVTETEPEANDPPPTAPERPPLHELATPPARRDPRGFDRTRPAQPVGVPVAAAEPVRANPAVKTTDAGESSEADRWLRTLSVGRHGGIAAALGPVYFASEEMAHAFRVPANREECLRVAQTALKSRLGRFSNMQRAPASTFRGDWVEPDLLPILDGLSNLYARALAEQRDGNPAAGGVATRLYDVLYFQLGQVCQDAGWFTIQTIIPFETEFDPIRHTAIGSIDADGASNRVVDIRQAGRLDAVSGTVIAAAHVVVGR